MSPDKGNAIVPDGYVRLEGSERRASSKANLIGQVDDNEKFKVTISLRRRKDGPPLPDLDYFTKTPPKLRKRLSGEEFTEKYGAHPDDINAVVGFVEKQGEVPGSAKAGDVLLVNVTATYPGIKGRAGRTVEFLEFVFVTARKRER